MHTPARLHALLALALAASACATSRPGGGARSFALDAGEDRCRVGSGRANPLVTEWPASEKANLEALLRSGAVAVEYTGCALRVLTGCRVGGAYAWQRTTPASDTLEIGDQDELYAKLPLGAVSLEGELKRSGKLTIHTAVSGQFRLTGASPADVSGAGECARATHVVGGLAVGAFALEGSQRTEGSAGVTVARFGEAGGRADRNAGLVRSAGDAQACGASTDAAPHPNCRSPIQVFLWAIPGRAALEGPPGTVKVDLVAANASTRWDVYYDDEVICSTPCSRFLDPGRPLLLRAREAGFARGADKIRVPDLEPWSGGGGVQVQAHGTSNGKLATGISFTSFGGMALLTGIALTSIGCGSDVSGSPGMCRGGLITLAAGAVVTGGAIGLIVDSMPRADIRPGGSRGRSISVAVGPGVIAGRF